jgi:hypothetical protein
MIEGRSLPLRMGFDGVAISVCMRGRFRRGMSDVLCRMSDLLQIASSRLLLHRVRVLAPTMPDLSRVDISSDVRAFAVSVGARRYRLALWVDPNETASLGRLAVAVGAWR